MVWKPKWLRRGGFLSAVRVVGTYLCCGTLLEVAVVVTQQIARVPRASGVFAGSLGGEGMALWVDPAVFVFYGQHFVPVTSNLSLVCGSHLQESNVTRRMGEAP